MSAQPWTARVWREFHAGNLTRAYRDVLLTLQTFRGAGGLIHPAHATLAARAGCSVRTVQRALRQAQVLDLVDWCERRIRAAWRWLRTSNAYRLMVPDGPIAAGLRPVWPCRRTTGQEGRGGEKLKKEDARQGRNATLGSWMAAAAQLPDLLAMRRATMQARMRAG